MSKLTVLAAIFCLCFQTVAVLAATPDYSGEWELDMNKSKLPDPTQIESMMLSVLQTKKDLRVGSLTKLNQNSTRGEAGSIVLNAVYSLEGEETLADIGSGVMAGSEKRIAKVTADGKLSLTTTRSFKSETGSGVTKSNETWELLDDGKTLKINRYLETPRGEINSEMYFTKKSAEEAGIATRIRDAAGIAKKGEPFDASNFKDGGVLNLFAYSLTRPEYPKAARAVRAGGVVLVKVTIDEKGDVISANAVSGHPLLRQAAEKAAQQAKFSPPTNQGKPAKVTGNIIYNFVP